MRCGEGLFGTSTGSTRSGFRVKLTLIRPCCRLPRKVWLNLLRCSRTHFQDESAVGGGRPSKSTKFCSVFCGRTTPSIQSSNESMRFRQYPAIQNGRNFEVILALQVKIGPIHRTCASSLLPQIVPSKVLQVASGHPVLTQEQRLENLSPGRRYRRSQVPSEQTIINSLSLAKHYIRYP